MYTFCLSFEGLGFTVTFMHRAWVKTPWCMGRDGIHSSTHTLQTFPSQGGPSLAALSGRSSKAGGPGRGSTS